MGFLRRSSLNFSRVGRVPRRPCFPIGDFQTTISILGIEIGYLVTSWLSPIDCTRLVPDVGQGIPAVTPAGMPAPVPARDTDGGNWRADDAR